MTGKHFGKTNFSSWRKNLLDQNKTGMLNISKQKHKSHLHIVNSSDPHQYSLYTESLMSCFHLSLRSSSTYGISQSKKSRCLWKRGDRKVPQATMVSRTIFKNHCPGILYCSERRKRETQCRIGVWQKACSCLNWGEDVINWPVPFYIPPQCRW